MQTGKKINQISNRLRRRSRAIQETIGISGAQGNILNYILVESQNRSVSGFNSAAVLIRSPV